MKIKLLAILLAGLVFAGCEYKSYEEHEIDPYNGLLAFTEVNKKADWKNRYDHASAAFDDKIWIFGGYNPGEIRGDTYYEDVWSSPDGLEWELVTDSAAWKGRRGHTVTVFDDGNGEALFLVGGFSVDEATGYRQYNNDVWKSYDGLNWEQLRESTPIDSTEIGIFYPRMEHVTVTANHGGTEYMYLIGGRTQMKGKESRLSSRYFNDVWRTTDGIHWDSLPNTDYGIRAQHAAAVDPYTGTIYIQGGMHGLEYVSDEPHPIRNWTHLWSSTDGITWVSQTSEEIEDYFGRADHSLVFYKGALWSFPGRSISTMHYTFNSGGHYRVWSLDVTGDPEWTLDEGSDLKARHSYGSVVFENKIWFLGGFTNDMGQDNDVWTAEIN